MVHLIQHASDIRQAHTPAKQTDIMQHKSSFAHLLRKRPDDLFISAQLKLQQQEHFNENINIKWGKLHMTI